MSISKLIKRKSIKYLRKRWQKTVAVFLALTMLQEIISPVCAFALTGGPSQPEVESFEPIGTSDMVDLFSGDFNYNLPLLDIDGYPINISYHSGITMDQEASWVGLGWNINAGVVNRNMRGMPDDFKGDDPLGRDIVSKHINIKPNETFGLNFGFGYEIFGFKTPAKVKGTLNFSLGIHYNNYRGVGIDVGAGIGLQGGKLASTLMQKFGVNFGLSSSSDEGLGIQASASFSQKIYGNDDGRSTSLGLAVGTSFNSRAGLQNLTISTSINRSKDSKDKKDRTKADKESDFSAGYSGPSSHFDFGQPTYTPEFTMPMQNLSVTASFKLGTESDGVHYNFTLGGFYSMQQLATNEIDRPAFGYLYADDGAKYKNSLMDFNREKDQGFSLNTPDLPVTNFTFDTYSVNGQGIGGSFRPFRGNMGYVFDAESGTTSNGYSVGLELGLADLFHAGIDFTTNDVEGNSGKWIDENDALPYLSYKKNPSDPTFESCYFKEANDKTVDSDPAFFAKQGGSGAEYINLDVSSKFHTRAQHYMSSGQNIAANNYRNNRDKRDQSISYLTSAELPKFGLEVKPYLYPGAKPHHLAEMTSIAQDGKRYVYGIAAYNTLQEETSFAVGSNLAGTGGSTGTYDCSTGLVNYSPGDNSEANPQGIDNYFSSTIMPPYAHSFLLTAVLSPDYVDADNVQGPSDGDLGSYTKFDYSKINNYKWRVPVGDHVANFNEGLKSDPTDDKANYIYGEKELYYLNKIETKNYIAIFATEPRKDANGVIDHDGKLNTSVTSASQLLRTISLYTKPVYNAWVNSGSPASSLPVPIKQVHFVYDYSLCPSVPNNSGQSEIVNGVDLNQAHGKLTLTKIYFTYQNSNKARLSPYVFTYGVTPSGGVTPAGTATDPPYNIKAYDRWGNYKPNPIAPGTVGSSCLGYNGQVPPLTNGDFPYVDQSNRAAANNNSCVWTMTQITLPSGGNIKVQYESDDYAYVQNKRAGQMFTIAAISDGLLNIFHTATSEDPVWDGRNQKLYFNLVPGQTDPKQYFEGAGVGDQVYFRFLMNIVPSGWNALVPPFLPPYITPGMKYEYVSGYATVKDEGIDKNKNMGWVQFQSVSLNGIPDFSPMTKAAIQFGRLNLPRDIWSVAATVTANNGIGVQILNDLIQDVKNIPEAMEGQNFALAKERRGITAVLPQSWIRLSNPGKNKIGGGSRVHQISIDDSWGNMAVGSGTSFSYGQLYDYTNTDGTSSGVASYEPQLGGDENPWKQPVFWDVEKMLAQNDEFYMEEPFGECFFPSASVGYGKVTVTNLKYANVHHNATGTVVHEFYTSYDYPVIPTRTSLLPQRDKSSPLALLAFFNVVFNDYMTTSQGYTIELNDMNGKPKRQSVYQESQSTPITSVEYVYQNADYIGNSKRLTNNATVINPDGTVNPNATLGVFSDFTSDMRESTTESVSSTTQANLDEFLIFAVPVPIPMIIPSSSDNTTRFRSAVITKVIQRFGLLQKVIAKDLGSTVETKNLAYDAETGEVLLSQTATDFNDAIFSLTYPAHWFYDGMGPAYKNIGVTYPGLVFSSGVAQISGASNYFAPGDELALTGGLSPKAWVTSVGANSITTQDRNGNPVSNGTYDLKITRSGRRNLSKMPMAKLTCLSNPLMSINSNACDSILQASAIEYSNDWKTSCECFGGTGSGVNTTTNPYVLGLKGNWRPKRSNLYLSPRTQSNYDNNTNIRVDGVFAAFTPFYKFTSGKWVIDPSNWTYTSQVTEFSPFGAELENQDALGRYSAATFGYNQTFATAVAANSEYREIGADNFEDYDFSTCSDSHFKFKSGTTSPTIDKTQSHTGRRSILVTSGAPVDMNKVLGVCAPVNTCSIAIASTLTTFSPSAGTSGNIIVSGGAGPYSLSWIILYGSPSITLSGLTGTQLSVSSATHFSVKVSVTDGKGCSSTNTFTQ